MLEAFLGAERGPFVQDVYQRRCQVFRSTAHAAAAVVTRERLDRLIEHTGCDLLLVRGGRAHEGGRPRTAAEAWALFDQGYTLALRNPDLHDTAFAELARGFAADLHGWPNLHVYCTPPEQQGFSWHYDPEEVFIAQVSGTKEYLARENTTHPLPVPEAFAPPAPERGEAPHQAWTLQPGDCLYLPAGQWHCARAVEASISLSVGLMPPTLLDALEYLRRAMAGSPAWRRRFPALGRAAAGGEAEKLAQCKALLAELAEEVSGALRSDALALYFLADSGRAFLRGQPISTVRPTLPAYREPRRR